MTKSKPTKRDVATLESLDVRRVELEQKTSSLRAQHTQSIIDGDEFDASAIREAEDELTAVMTAQETLHQLRLDSDRREAEAMERLSDEEKRKRIADRLFDLEAKWLKEVEDIEAAVRAAAAAYGRASERAKMLHIALLSQGSSGHGLIGNAFEGRVGDGISSILHKQVQGSTLGRLKFGATIRDPNLPWVEAEAAQSAEVARTVESVLNADVEAA